MPGFRTSRHFRLLAIAALAVGLLMLAWPVPARAEQPTGLELAVAATQTEYGTDGPITLRFTVTNRQDRSCLMAPLADGTVQLLAVSRDGKRVEPEMLTARHINGLTHELTSQLTSVSPGESVSFEVTSVPYEGRSLAVTDPTPGGGGLAGLWPVGSAAHYEISASYRVPPLEEGTCTGVSNTAAASFTVGNASADDEFPVVLVAAAGAGAAIVLVLLGWMVIRRRKKAAMTVIALSGVCLSVIASPPAPADAELIVPPSEGKILQNMVKICQNKFKIPGSEKDIGGFMDTITSGDTRPVLIISDDSESRTLGMNGKGAVVILWNPFDTSDLEPGVPNDRCGSLYHELFHASEFLQNKSTEKMCGNTGIKTDEVRATFMENRWRKMAGKDLRTQYEGKKLPKSEDACKGKPSRPNAPVCRAVGGGCGSSNGDPHITTFDQQHYSFQAVGEFAAISSGDDLVVQTRQSPWLDSRTVSINTAVAASVGGDRVGFYMEDGLIAASVEGERTAGSQPLPSGGELITRHDDFLGLTAYTLTWPDGSWLAADPIGFYGIRLTAELAEVRAGTATGLFGDFDGESVGDLVTRQGEAIGAELDHDSLYGRFGDSWRITPEESLFDYADGDDTETFTDRSFPDEVVTVDTLSTDSRERAESACELAGITDPVLFDDCVLDVSVTGLPAFAVNAIATQEVSSADPDDSEPSDPGGRTVEPGGTLHDLDLAEGTVDGEVHQFEVDFGDATVVRLVDVEHESSVVVELVGPFGTGQSGFTVTSNYQYRVVPGEDYRFEVSGEGAYRFRLVLAKEQRMDAAVGDLLSGELEERGRVDLYTFTPDRAGDIYPEDASDCGDIQIAVVDDVPDPHVYTPSSPCFEIPLATVEPGRSYLLIIWSAAWETGSYDFRIDYR